MTPCSFPRIASANWRSALTGGGQYLYGAHVDEGLPAAYQVLEDGVPVYGSDGEQVGTVAHVVALPQVGGLHHRYVRRAA